MRNSPKRATVQVTTGPAVAYWNPANKATGDYTVKATFTEPKYMNLNSHPHPYGIMIGGNEWELPAELPLLRGLRKRAIHRARIRSRSVLDERSAGEANAAVHKARGVENQ